MRLRRSTAPRPPPRQRPLLEELEPRILFSADAAAGLLDVNQLDVQAQVRLLESAPVAPEPAAATEAVQQSRHEIVFVDTRVADYQMLLDDLLGQNNDTRQIEVFLLDPNQDGIEQISSALSNESGLSAVHIISHGGDGAVQLGGAVLDFDTLVRNATQIKGWAEAFASDGDLLLYGCDVAATAEGRTLVDALGRLTGTDVAASTDLTGDARLGGDWTLEYATGEIEARAVVDGAGSGAWSGVLAITQNGSATSAKTDSATSLTWSHTVASGSDRALFVTLAIDGLGANVTGVTYGGAAMTQVGRTSGNHAVEIWSLVNPAVGTADVFVNFGGSTTPAAGGAVAYNGVNQSTPTGTYSGANGTGTTSSVTVTSAAGELVIDAENWRGSAAGYAVGEYQSLLWSQTNATNTGKSTTEAGAVSVTMSSTVSLSAQWEIGAVSIKPVANSAPMITSNGGGASASVNVAENSTAATTVTATDANGDTLSYAISGGADAAKFTINSSTGALSFTSAPNYESPTDAGANNVYDVTVQVSDGNGGTDTQAIAVTVTNTNDAPVNAAPAGQYTAYNTARVFSSGNGNQISISDADAGANPVQVSLTVGHGVLTLAGTTGLSFTAGANGSATMTFTGTVAAINTALNGMSYTPTASYRGQDALQIVTNDLGNSGSGGAQSDSDTVNLHVGAIVVTNANDLTNGSTASLSALAASDGGDGISLREALQAANATAGADYIYFNITGTGAHTITPSTALPTITQAVIIDATTDDSFAANSNRPAIILDGNNLAADGLVLSNTADGSTIRGLVIRDFGGDGIEIQAGSDGNTIVGNYVGRYTTTGSDAGAGEANAGYGIQVLGSGNLIGGLTAADRNLVGGNGIYGIAILGAGATANVVQGNYIGTDSAGTTAIGNAEDGIWIDGATNNTIGGTQAGAGNLVSGNAWSGIALTSGADSNLIAGNLIGTNAAGTAALGNGNHGINVTAANNTIGGTTAYARNVIAGNGYSAIMIYGESADGNQIVGNYLGTNANGTAALPNGWDGVSVTGGADNTQIGGTSATQRNVISGNTEAGIYVSDSSTTGTVMEGNYIGVAADGSTALGNGWQGVAIVSSASNSLVGGTADGAGNIIANNGASGFDGVEISTAGTGNAVLGNSIYGNTQLGIDLGTSGVTANDNLDADNGANNLQNFPVLSPAGTDGSKIAIAGTINSTFYTTLRLEFFANVAGDATGYGEGQTYLGYATVFTDASGNSSFVVSFDKTVSAGQAISATATVMNANGTYGSTSEFSANVTAANALIVDTTADTVDGTTTSIANLLANKGADGKISLREAIIATNNTAGQDTIFLPAGTYTLTRTGSSENLASTGDLDILQNLTLIGAGASSTIVNATGLSDRVFEVSGTGTSAYLSGITVTGGNISNGGGMLANSNTSLTLWDSAIANNTSGTNGGGLYTSGTTFINNVTVSGNSGESGAGIYSNNTLVISNSTIAANTGSNEGGGIWSSGTNANLTLINTTISGNSNSGQGGGLYNGKTASLVNVTIAGNTAGQGGGIFKGAGGTVTTTLRNTIVAGNTATGTNPNPDISGAMTSSGNNIIGNTTGNSGWVASDKQDVNPLLNALASNGGPTQTMSLQAGSPAINAGSATNAPVIDQRGYYRDANCDIGAYEYNATSPYGSSPVNTVPGAQTVNEDTALAIGGISAADADGNLATVRLTALHGDLTVGLAGGATISAGANSSASLTLSGTQAQINAALATLSYQGSANYNGGDVLTVTSTDTPGEVDSDTVAITVLSVNDAPAGADKTITASEDTEYVFTTADFGFTDVDGNALMQVWFDTLPGSGTLKWNGAPFAAGNWVDAGDIALGLLTYTPASNVNGSAVASFTFRVQDDGGTANGGVDLDPSPNTITINIAAANDAPTFTAGDGAVITAVGSGADYAYGTAVQDDGKVLVVGYASNGSNNDFALVRYNADGALDTGFGTGGKVTTAIGSADDYGRGVTLQSDGKILVTGYTWNGVDYDFALARYDANGTLDATFGTGGIVTTAVGTKSDVPYKVVVQPDGKIIAAGYYSNGSNSDFAMVRYTSTGALDTSFGTGGKVTTAIGASTDIARAISIQPDGKIILAGQSLGSNDDFAVVRYNPDGSLDTAFGTGGKVTTDFGVGSDTAYGAMVQADGKIVVAGTVTTAGGTDFGLVRYNADGTVDTGFGMSGKVTVDAGGSDIVFDAKLQHDGKIVLAGTSSGNLALLRFTSSGALDAGFGTGGIVTTDLGGTENGSGIVVQPDGKIVFVGYTDAAGTSDIALVRYTAVGTLDTAWDVTPTLGNVVAFTEGGSAVVLEPLATVHDPELSAADNFNGATLTLARNGGAQATDVFSASGTLGVLTQGGALVVGSTTIGTVTINSGGTLLLSFNANATNARVNQAMQQIAYASSSHAPLGSVQIDWTFTDGNSGMQGSGGVKQCSGDTTVSVTNVNDAPTGAPVITGTTSEDQTLGIDVSSIADADGLGAFSYQWLRNGSAIVGATGAAYTLDDADVGADISVTVSYTDGQGTNESLTSAAVGPVANVNDAPVMTGAWMSLRLGETVVLSTANIGAQDVDDAISSLVFSVRGLTGGRFELAAQPGQAISSFTFGDLNAGSVRFVQDGSTAVPAFNISASDGKAGSAAFAAHVTFDASTGVGGEYPGGVGGSSDGGDGRNSSAVSNTDGTGPGSGGPAVTNPSTETPPSTSQNGGTGVGSALGSGAVEQQVLARSPDQMVAVQVPPVAKIVLADVSSRRAEIDISPGMALDEYMLRLVSLKLAAAEHGGAGHELSVAGAGMDQASHDEAAAHELSIQTAQVLGISLTVGTVWWALRVSGLVGGLLASLPAWRQLDLLMILPDDGERESSWGDNDDTEALRDELAVSELLVIANQEVRR